VSTKKLVLCVIDAMAPAMLERAVAEGVAPMLATLIERGRYIPDCVAAFPSAPLRSSPAQHRTST